MGERTTSPGQARAGDWTTGPAKWGSAGFLGGASLVGLIWVLGAREPAPLVQRTNAAVEFSPELAALPAPAVFTEPALFPETGPDGSRPAASAPEPATTDVRAPEPAPTPKPEPSTAKPAPATEPADDEAEDLPESRLVDLEPTPAPSDPEPEPEQPLRVRIRVNVASAAELELLPGVGPVIARRIAEDRAANGYYRSLMDLQRVKGIGPKTAAKLADHVRFD